MSSLQAKRTGFLAAGAMLAVAALSACSRAGDAPAPPPESGIERPFLWVTEGGPRIYLFGTIHVPDVRVRTLPAVVERARESSDVFYGEIPQDDASAGKARAAILLPAGQTLGKVLPPETHARLKKFLEGRGLRVEPFDRFKVWGVAVTVSLLDHLPDLMAHPPMDKDLYQRSQKAGAQVGGLETVEEQMSIFDGMSAAEQATFLDASLAQLEKDATSKKSAMTELIDLYCEGDEKKLEERFHADFASAGADGAKVEKALIDDRNVRMVDRLLERVHAAPEKTCFVAVGAAHLPGEKGMLALLAAKGHATRRVAKDERIPAEEPVPAGQ